jgi:hypothetical protein
MKLKSMLFAVGLLPLLANANVCRYAHITADPGTHVFNGPTFCEPGQVDEIEVNGFLSVSGTTIGKVTVNGQSGTIDANINEMVINGDLQTRNTKLNQLQLLGSKGASLIDTSLTNINSTGFIFLTNSKVAGSITITNSGNEPRKIVSVGSSSVVQGNITFVGKDGVVYKSKDSTINGQVINGRVIEE